MILPPIIYRHPNQYLSFNINMKRLIIVHVIIWSVFQLRAYCSPLSDTIVKHSDTIFSKAQKLKRLYVLSTASSTDASDKYKQQFFDEFPSTFEQLNELYGYNYDTNKPAPLYNEFEKHIVDLFNNLNNINDTLYYKKIISIAIGGHWDGDAINAFQHGLQIKVLNNPELTVYILKNMPENKISSFWYFYFDGVHPKKQIPARLQSIESVNNRVYNLMIDAQNEVLKHPKE